MVIWLVYGGGFLFFFERADMTFYLITGICLTWALLAFFAYPFFAMSNVKRQLGRPTNNAKKGYNCSYHFIDGGGIYIYPCKGVEYNEYYRMDEDEHLIVFLMENGKVVDHFTGKGLGLTLEDDTWRYLKTEVEKGWARETCHFL